MKPIKNQLWYGLWFKVRDRARSVCRLETLIRIEDRISSQVYFQIRARVEDRIRDNLDETC